MKFIAVKDLRTGKIYLDLADSMVRNFELIVARHSSISRLRAAHPDALDLTAAMDPAALDALAVDAGIELVE